VNRYRRAWKRGDCDPKNYNFASLNVSHTKIFEMRTKQFCPEVEDIEIPETGLFIISNAYGRHNGSSFLVDKPFGTVNGFAATEVQYRSSRNVKVLAKTRFLEMLGPIGPLVGYWETHGDFATFPRGAKGWGYWRPIMTGGSYNHLLNMEWIFDHVLLQRNADATEKARVPQN
jgi:hypothetical protein